MNLKKALHRNAVCLQLQSASKEGLIAEMVDLLLEAGLIHDREAALTAIQTRESKMSTGMQNGIAIPHGKTDTVDALVAAVGIHHPGIEFDAIDQQPCTLFIMTLSPVNRTGPHIQFLAEISRLLNDDAVRQELLAAPSADDVIRILTA